jgi:hypothetical protein
MKRLPTKLTWKALAFRRWKTDLGGDLPEVVILLMNNAEFKKFRATKKGAMKFIDGEGFLKRPLIELVFCDVVSQRCEEPWIVIVTHTTHSTAVIVAWQIPE